MTATILTCGPATADIFNPAYLQLSEESDGEWALSWRVPARGRARLAMHPRLPASWQRTGAVRSQYIDGYYLERWSFRAENVAGAWVRFDGLQGGVTDVIARVQYRDGSEQVERLSSDSEGFELRPPAGSGQVASTYFVLGMEHILLGLDHLLFVLALLLVIEGWRQIVATITAFTVAHSVTLVAAALGWLGVPIAPVEAIIALSIVFVAAEAVHYLRGRPGITARSPWIVAFTFGLIHGLGFASALNEIGLPAQAIPIALLAFNVGVEAGQLLFVAVMLTLARLLRHWPTPLRTLGQTGIAYGIGSIASYWTMDRVAFGVLGL